MEPIQVDPQTILSNCPLPLESVLCTDELHQRPSRQPDYQRESRALGELAQALADSPRSILQRLTEVALHVCEAGSAGISLLRKDDGEQSFYWPAIAGAWAPHAGGGMPRGSSPCGVVLDRNAVQLFERPERHYRYLVPIAFPIVEALLTPFYVQGRAVGTVWVISHEEKRRFDAEDMRLIVSLGNFASAAYQMLACLEEVDSGRAALDRVDAALQSRQAVEVLNKDLRREIADRKQADAALRRSEAQLEAELGDTHLLQRLSAALVEEDNIEGLYQKILDGAVAIMRSDYASMQMLYPERGRGGELKLLAYRGFDRQAVRFWEWVGADSASACGVALRARERVTVPDVYLCDFMVGTKDLETYRQSGIRAVQTTPLVSRTGKLLGMLSTHWQNPHGPSERDLRLLDILVRQAADLIDRKQAEGERERLLKQLETERERLKAFQAELQEKIGDLEKFNEVVVGRELKMIAQEEELARLRKENAALKAQTRSSTSS
jgi:GAF domain-containing protein